MTRRQTSLAVLGGGVLALLVLSPSAFFVIFAGLLLGVGISGAGQWIADRAGLGRGWGVAILLLGILAAAVLVSLLFAPAIAEQIDELTRTLPTAVESLRTRLEQYEWLDRLISSGGGASLPEGTGAAAAGALFSVLGAGANILIALAIGIYGAISPGIYRRGLLLLVAPSARSRAEEVIAASVKVLRRWFGAQLVSMAVVGVLTTIGLWLVGVPLAPLLGLIAGLLGFVPNIGPILSAVPAVLLASTQGGTAALLTVGVFLVVQALESYLITPKVQQDQVS
ncbi:MAG: AI-2E family transporter, partial [Rhodobacterales bacterium 17-64-5]